jgi:hypothetical protein
MKTLKKPSTVALISGTILSSLSLACANKAEAKSNIRFMIAPDEDAAYNGSIDPEADTLADEIKAMREEMREQREQLKQQATQIAAQQEELKSLKAIQPEQILRDMRAVGLPMPTPPLLPYEPDGFVPLDQNTATPGNGSTVPDRPVGAPPPPQPSVESKVEAVPEGQGVLTPPGTLTMDTAFEYTRSSTNRLVFRGIELIPGIQVGLIEASDADRDTISGTIALRTGLTNRLEIEARMPVLFRHDRIEVVQQRDQGIVRSIGLRETAPGDAELSLRYQLNKPKGQNPIFIAGVRVKSDTGKSPFSVGYDEFGVATGLATGSGFWGVQPSVSMLLASDPVVIFGGANYLWHLPKNVNKDIGGAFVGRVDPGDAVGANLGFGFALNPRFSFSLGYKHSYIFPTRTEIGDTDQKSRYLQVGMMGFGMSYRLSTRQSVNFGFEFGVTKDAPDVGISLRLPLNFNLKAAKKKER